MMIKKVYNNKIELMINACILNQEIYETHTSFSFRIYLKNGNTDTLHILYK